MLTELTVESGGDLRYQSLWIGTFWPWRTINMRFCATYYVVLTLVAGLMFSPALAQPAEQFFFEDIQVSPGLLATGQPKDSRGGLEYIFLHEFTWAPGSTLQVCFFGGIDTINLKIVEFAQEWAKYANIKFVFRDDKGFFDCNNIALNNTSNVRIGFACPGNWSLLGKESIDANVISRPPKCASYQQSMNIVVTPKEMMSEPKFRQIVIHEFGHVLGLKHEHQNPSAAGCKNEFAWEVIRNYLVRDQKWDPDDVDRNFAPPQDSSAATFGPFDPSSIMLYPMPPFFFTRGRHSPCWISDANLELSARDKLGVAMLYPNNSMAAFQERIQQTNKTIEVLINRPSTLSDGTRSRAEASIGRNLGAIDALRSITSR